MALTQVRHLRWLVGVVLCFSLRVMAQNAVLQPLGDKPVAAKQAKLSSADYYVPATPDTVRWVTNQNSRWGSCTPAEGSIRLSHRLQGMPEYVIDYVMLHELAHLLVPDHGPHFWKLLESYPRTERARGFLDGVAAADRLPNPQRNRDESRGE